MAEFGAADACLGHNARVAARRVRSWLVILGIGACSFVGCAGEEFDGPAGTGAAGSGATGGSTAGGGASGSAVGGSPTGGASGKGGEAGVGGSAGEGKIVFVSSNSLAGDFGLAADPLLVAGKLCETEAAAAPALVGKQWRAWLSTGISDAISVLTGVTGPWRRVDGSPVFNSAEEIASGTKPVNPINKTASGSSLSVHVWTGTNSNGKVGAVFCEGWSSLTAYGIYGLSSATDTWTNSNADQCVQSKHLYCFEI